MIIKPRSKVILLPYTRVYISAIDSVTVVSDKEIREPTMPRHESEVVGKPLSKDVGIAAHAIRVRTTMPTLG